MPDLKDMARLFAGKDNWTTMNHAEDGIPSIRMSDGPHGLRIEKAEGIGFNASHPATLYPTAALSACSFDRDLQYELGTHLARECIDSDVNILLGPGVNHKRSPLCGRNFEYYSEDPYLTGEMAASYVNGLQDHGVGASVKHFAGNSRELGRMVEDSVIDERALREIYLSQFETVIRKAKPATVMCAYNRLNGTYCAENSKLMGLARHEWGFDGVYVSDWGAVADPAKSLAAGLNLEMPGGDHGSDDRILAGLQNGTVSESRLRESTEYIQKLTERVSASKAHAEVPDRLDFAERLAAESSVLLRNQGALPLKKDMSCALIGPFARSPRIQGGGSAKVNPNEVDCLYDVMKKNRAVFSYAPGFTLDPETVNEELEDQALALAERSSCVIVVAGLSEQDESEGFDRKHMHLPHNQNHLIHALTKVNRNVIVILQCGSPVEVPWKDEVNAILCMYLSGCRSGSAAWKLLSGRVNPSGKLAETWPATLADTPCHDTFNDHLLQVQYRESIYTGYRWYDAAGIEPAYPFGYGLSYTDFAYSDLSIEEGDPMTVKVKVKNTGSRKGKETVQLYLSMKDSRIARPLRELKGFEKLELEPGETKEAVFILDDRSFSYFDTEENAWMVEAGKYQIEIGASSRDIRLSKAVFHQGTLQPSSRIPKGYAENAAKNGSFTKAGFEEVLGHKVPEIRSPKPFSVNTSFLELQEEGLGKLLNKGIRFVRSKKEFPGVTDEMIMEVPIRSAMMVSSSVTWDTVDAIVDLFNGKRSFLGVIRTLKKKQ